MDQFVTLKESQSNYCKIKQKTLSYKAQMLDT